MSTVKPSKHQASLLPLQTEKASRFIQCKLLRTFKQSQAQCVLRLGTTGKRGEAEFRWAGDSANVPAMSPASDGHQTLTAQHPKDRGNLMWAIKFWSDPQHRVLLESMACSAEAPGSRQAVGRWIQPQGEGLPSIDVIPKL